jgi:predicted TIM-barrel fold metal-dependent hydrolase
MAFRTGGTADYPIIDADTHVTEPPDLWTARLPQKYLENAPRVIDGLFGGKAWAVANGKQMAVSILVNTAGQSATDWELIPKDGYDRMRKGGWDPAERISDMDIDMVDIHLIFPSYAFIVVDNPDREAYLANIRAYNDWMAEFCSHAPERLYAYAIMPVSGVEDAVAEATRVRNDYDCFRSVVLRTWPNGSLIAKHPVDDPFWSALEDLDMGVACHVGFDIIKDIDDPDVLLSMATLPYINQEKLAISAMPALSEIVLGGVLERHPRLRFGFIEVGIAWVPFFLEQSNDNYLRHRFWTHTNLPMPPSEYWGRQCFASFQVDRYGIENRHKVGIDTIMWTSDYPHAGSDWPYARERIAAQLHDVPEDEKGKILCHNAARYFGLTSSDVAKAALP